MQTFKGRFRGSVVVVTGASAGVGRATARAFAAAGASVGLLARGPDGLAAAKKDVEDKGAHALAVETDVAAADQVEAAAEAIEEELGPIDVWVNNAMVSTLMPLSEMEPEDFKRVTDVTYLGSVYGTMTALRRMLPRNRGSIIQVGSALAYRGIPLQSAYCGAKHALQGFTESVRCELMHEASRVTISMVQLPALNTPQFHWVKTSFDRHPQPVAPIYQPELAAEAILWSAANYRREVNVGETTVATVIADKLAPGLLDRYLAASGYDSQLDERPIEPDRSDNLWQPVPGDHGARGEFDERSWERSLQWAASRHRRWIALGSGVAALAAALKRRAS
ncbi:MAG TPA: SDR family oxidoreductase [Actinomycetota bacterium]|nr:SDR family oxidoreductase [Actinomycetota bacterium]